MSKLIEKRIWSFSGRQRDWVENDGFQVVTKFVILVKLALFSLPNRCRFRTRRPSPAEMPLNKCPSCCFIDQTLSIGIDRLILKSKVHSLIPLHSKARATWRETFRLYLRTTPRFHGARLHWEVSHSSFHHQNMLEPTGGTPLNNSSEKGFPGRWHTLYDLEYHYPPSLVSRICKLGIINS